MAALDLKTELKNKYRKHIRVVVSEFWPLMPESCNSDLKFGFYAKNPT